jgi:hypothetical protein
MALKTSSYACLLSVAFASGPLLAGDAQARPSQLGPVVATRVQAAAAVADAATALSGSEREFSAAAFRLAPEDLARVLADSSARRAFLHDVLFEADPRMGDPHLWAPAYRQWNPDLQTLTVHSLGVGSVLSTLLVNASARPGATLSSASEAEFRAVADVLVQGSPALFDVHWDNRDDARLDAVIAVDAVTGDVRIFLTHIFG